MKVKDNTLGVILETDNEFVIEQFKKSPERYKQLPKAKQPKANN